jgi:mono/diheme cytochrome c family protein
MRSRVNLFVWGLLALSSLAVFEGAAAPQKQADTKQEKASARVDEAAEGAKRFAINCGRCHQPPQDISPREARAVLRHMRTRAMLSAEDERLILKFIAP